MTFPWLKGHGTENDFVLLPDPDGSVHGELDAALVRALCDRHAGIGGDGVLRVVRCTSYGPARDWVDAAEWFMDYRNADGSVAEMCGNGVRVFARYLCDAGLVDPVTPVPVATRGGLRVVRREPDGRFTATMGRAVPVRQRVQLYVSLDGRRWPAYGLQVPNPHAVAFVDDLADAGSLLEPPLVEPAGIFPDGVNVELVVRRGRQHVAMRVHERGVGETRSCGTGACAAAVAAMRADGAAPGTRYVVDVPGGRLEVVEQADGELEMTGPAVLVARGEVEPSWLAGLGLRH